MGPARRTHPNGKAKNNKLNGRPRSVMRGVLATVADAAVLVRFVFFVCVRHSCRARSREICSSNGDDSTQPHVWLMHGFDVIIGSPNILLQQIFQKITSQLSKV